MTTDKIYGYVGSVYMIAYGLSKKNFVAACEKVLKKNYNEHRASTNWIMERIATDSGADDIQAIAKSRQGMIISFGDQNINRTYKVDGIFDAEGNRIMNEGSHL